MEESQRQKKIAGLIQQDLADVLQLILKESGLTGTLISVSKVSVTVDLSNAKAYLSVFPTNNSKEILKEIQFYKKQIKHELAQRTKHQLRRMPEINFYIDDSLDYIKSIEDSLKGEENPIKNPDLLAKRKKK